MQEITLNFKKAEHPAEQVKAALLKLHDCAEDFSVVFFWKRKNRVNGYYLPATQEIVIHELNFLDDEGETDGNKLFLTAMHELAHHIQFTEKGQTGNRCHTKLFYSILAGLVDTAEELGMYQGTAG